MAITLTSDKDLAGLPDSLQVAQKAINLPEVQEMLRKLANYNLGICMPHMHDDDTGAFLPLPDDMVQVEAGLEVTFQPTAELARRPQRYVQVGWFWRKGAEPTTLAYCTKACFKKEDSTDTMHYSRHERRE